MAATLDDAIIDIEKTQKVFTDNLRRLASLRDDLYRITDGHDFIAKLNRVEVHLHPSLAATARGYEFWENYTGYQDYKDGTIFGTSVVIDDTVKFYEIRILAGDEYVL